MCSSPFLYYLLGVLFALRSRGAIGIFLYISHISHGLGCCDYLCINADLFMKKIDLLGIFFMIVNIAFELFTSRRAL